MLSETSKNQGNLVDVWIDDLEVTMIDTNINSDPNGISATGMISWLVAENLPKIELPSRGTSSTFNAIHFKNWKEKPRNL